MVNWVFGRRPFMGNKYTAYLLHPQVNGRSTTYIQDDRTGEDALFDTLAAAKDAAKNFMRAGQKTASNSRMLKNTPKQS